MKICFVHEEYPEETNFGGIATYQKIMAEELVKQNNEVYVICRGLKKDTFYTENGVKIYRVYVKNSIFKIFNYVLYRIKVAKILYKLQKSNEIDIIEVPDWGAETVFFEKLRKIPLVVRLHTPLKIWLNYNKNDFGNIKKIMLYWENKMLQSASLITCCSNVLKDIVVENYKINKDEIIVTPNPANIVNFYRNEEIVKENKLLFVGSLEERKGVLVLSKALNIIFDKYPDLKIDIIGKDTTRNYKNISSKKLIYEIVDYKYHNNLNFCGQLTNTKINNYLNTSRVAIFPSLFDNFPYVVLEAMMTGIHIVGSSNSGMVEMLNNRASIYNVGDYNDLANKIIQKYEISFKQEIDEKNIDRVKSIYNSYKIITDMTKLYESTINKYIIQNTTKKELQDVLKLYTNEKIISYKKQNGGVSNIVYKIKTPNNIYILKKYLYNYNFNLSNKLYQKFENYEIKVIKPLNRNVINYNGVNYNIFQYIKDSSNSIKKNKIDLTYLTKLVVCDRKTDELPTILDKCIKYYNYLKDKNIYSNLNNYDIKYVCNIFEKLKDMDFLNERYLNHGDISLNNIILNHKNIYLIDFDEVTISTPLYDFAVISIKNFVKKGSLNINKYKNLMNEVLISYNNYSKKDFNNITKFYLCKILLEKFYYHELQIIDLYSKEQKKDNYKLYLSLLRKLDANLVD